MKTLLSLIAVLLLSAGYAAAQDANSVNTTSTHSSGTSDITGFRAPQTPISESSKPNPNVVLKPKTGGVFVDGAKEGWVIISPAAPSSYGLGEKYLSAPSTRADLQHESGPAAHRDTGGIKLFTIEF
jgi:hypothetical protein